MPKVETVAFMQELIPNLTFIDACKLSYPDYHLPLQREGEFNGCVSWDSM